MQLPCGITGSALPHRDVRQFRADCHVVARSVGGNVASQPHTFSPSCSFYALAIDDIAVLLNLHHPYLAFAKAPLERGGPLDFVSAPAITAAFASFDRYRVLPLVELRSSPTQHDLTQLSAAELKDITYWRPQSLGEMIFNGWD